MNVQEWMLALYTRPVGKPEEIENKEPEEKPNTTAPGSSLVHGTLGKANRSANFKPAETSSVVRRDCNPSIFHQTGAIFHPLQSQKARFLLEFFKDYYGFVAPAFTSIMDYHGWIHLQNLKHHSSSLLPTPKIFQLPTAPLFHAKPPPFAVRPSLCRAQRWSAASGRSKGSTKKLATWEIKSITSLTWQVYRSIYIYIIYICVCVYVYSLDIDMEIKHHKTRRFGMSRRFRVAAGHWSLHCQQFVNTSGWIALERFAPPNGPSWFLEAKDVSLPINLAQVILNSLHGRPKSTKSISKHFKNIYSYINYINLFHPVSNPPKNAPLFPRKLLPRHVQRTATGAFGRAAASCGDQPPRLVRPPDTASASCRPARRAGTIKRSKTWRKKTKQRLNTKKQQLKKESN